MKAAFWVNSPASIIHFRFFRVFNGVIQLNIVVLDIFFVFNSETRVNIYKNISGINLLYQV